MAVTFAPDAEYVALDTGEWIYIVAKELAQQTIEKCSLGECEGRSRTFPGAKLEHATFAHPFLDRKILGVLADYVTMDTGTGAVHTAPAHGADDFYTGVKYGLDLHCNVDDAGILRNGLPEYEGKQVFKANPLDRRAAEEPRRAAGLREDRALVSALLALPQSRHLPRHRAVVHLHGWQRFPGGTLRSRALDEIKKVKWDPAWGEERISNMIATRPDWCISRQRIWGVPIAVFQCEGCKEFAERSRQSIKLVVDLFAREGADAWYKHSAEQILPAGYEVREVRRDDVPQGDGHHRRVVRVRFEPGGGAGSRAGLPWPADLYLEGGDQHRGWFQSSLLCAVATKGAAPYPQLCDGGLDARSAGSRACRNRWAIRSIR